MENPLEKYTNWVQNEATAEDKSLLPGPHSNNADFNSAKPHRTGNPGRIWDKLSHLFGPQTTAKAKAKLEKEWSEPVIPMYDTTTGQKIERHKTVSEIKEIKKTAERRRGFKMFRMTYEPGQYERIFNKSGGES